jgi:hypothetical protein
MPDRYASDPDTTHLEACIARADGALTHAMALYAIAANALENAVPGVPIEGNQRFSWLANFTGMGTVVEEDAVTTVDLERFEILLIEGEQNFKSHSIEVLRGIIAGYVAGFSPDIDDPFSAPPEPTPLHTIEIDEDGTVRLVLHDALSSLTQHALWSRLEALLLSGDPIDPAILADIDIEQLSILMGDVGSIGLSLDDPDSPLRRVRMNDDSYWQTALWMGGYADAILMDDFVAHQLPSLRESLVGFSPDREHRKLDQILALVNTIPQNIAHVPVVEAKKRFEDFVFTARLEVDSRAYLQTVLRTGTAVSEEWQFRDLLIRNYRSLNPIEIRHLVGMSTYELSEFVYRELSEIYTEYEYLGNTTLSGDSRHAYRDALRASYTAVRMARKERYNITDPLEVAVEIALFFMGFMGAVSRYVDFYDALRLLSRGDAAGALTIFLPEAVVTAISTVRRMGSRVNHFAQSALNRVRSTGLNHANPPINIQAIEEASGRLAALDSNFPEVRVEQTQEILYDLRDVPKTKRFEIFKSELKAAPAASSYEEAKSLIDNTLNRIEDRTGITNIPENWQSDGRMYPVLSDNVKPDDLGNPNVRRLISRGHVTYIGNNGAIEIRTKPSLDNNSDNVFSKPGADGKGLRD